MPVLGLERFRGYYRYLKYSPEQQKEFDELVERVTTNETYFFRESYQLEVFIKDIIPELNSRKAPGERVRIWSAGCSTGEEPYTLGMLLDEAGYIRRNEYEIFGNDISRKVLQTARSGVYRESSFRTTEERYLRRYFSQDGRLFVLDDRIRNIVTFGNLNLMDDKALAVVGRVDVIFCRNVMIYFTPEARRRLLKVFYSRLRPGGFLLLGHSESLINESTDFELVTLRRDMVYRKPLGPEAFR